jgi:hypothetical protein
MYDESTRSRRRSRWSCAGELTNHAEEQKEASAYNRSQQSDDKPHLASQLLGEQSYGEANTEAVSATPPTVQSRMHAARFI